MTYPNLWKLKYKYDKIRRMTLAEQQEDGADLVAYAYMGDYIRQKVFGDGVVTWRDVPHIPPVDNLDHYDAYGRPIFYNYVHDTTNLVKIKYAYDKASNVTWRFDELMNIEQGPHWTQAYTYDNLHRLIAANQGWMNGGWEDPPYVNEPTPAMASEGKTTWTWDDSAQSGDCKLDKLGNWEHFDNAGTPDVRMHNVANEITARDVDCVLKALEYDAAGNLVKLDRDVDPQTTEHLQFAYDYRNRLISATSGGNEIAEYFYDALNRRVRVKKPLTPATDTVYLYDGWQCVEEREPNLQGTAWEAKRQYVYGAHYLDELVARDDLGASPETYFFLQDTNYNVVAL